MAAGVFRQDELKFQAAAMALSRLRYDGVSLGETDLALRPTFVGSALDALRVPVLCANLDPLPAWSRSFQVRSVAGVQIALVGVTDPDLVAATGGVGQDTRVADPLTVLRDLAPEIQTKADLVVLVAHARLERAREWSRLFSKPCVVVTGHAEQAEPVPPEARPNGVVVQPGAEGRHLIRLALYVDAGGCLKSFDYRAVPVVAPVAPDAEALAFLRWYQSRLAAEDIVGKAPQAPLRPGQRFAGTEPWRACHTKEHTAWQSSAHAKAYPTLLTARREADPECVSCHTVGFGLQSGFAGAGRTPKLTDVGCESCHGPAAKHAADPRTKTPGDARGACAHCHTHERSPAYDALRYLERIRHW